MDRPQTRYVAVGDADVAYQVVGEGPVDLLYCFGLGSHIELFWDIPHISDFLEKLASFSRLVIFDRRGVGASDGIPSGAIPTWEEWAEDIGAVLDAVGSKRAALFARSDAGPMAMLYSASHPERVSALILYNTTARYLVADDYPIGYSQESVDAVVELIRTSWGTADSVILNNPSLVDDTHQLNLFTKLLRSSVTPRSAAAQYEYLLQNGEARHVLPLIQVPTLVFSLPENPIISIEHGRYLASHIENAKFVELPGAGIYPGARDPELVEMIAEFVTGERPVIEVDRILTTVLFTDIVGSTELATKVGDHRWSELLNTHNEIVRSELHHFRGQEIDTAGDGFFAIFDGPARAIRCARAIRDGLRADGFEIRAGLHTGEVELVEGGVRGLTVHIGARIGAAAKASQILVSRTVADLIVGSGIKLDDQGEHTLKGAPGAWRLFAVSD
jgi:class 3 adenylate cyclase